MPERHMRTRLRSAGQVLHSLRRRNPCNSADDVTPERVQPLSTDDTAHASSTRHAAHA
jgi:hypothetical protein